MSDLPATKKSKTAVDSDPEHLSHLPKFIDIKVEAAADADLFSIPRHYVDDVESVLVPHGLILDRFEH